MSVEFSEAELSEFSLQMKTLTQKLADLEAELELSEACSEKIEQRLAMLNESILSLRRHWRHMLQLSPPKSPR